MSKVGIGNAVSFSFQNAALGGAVPTFDLDLALSTFTPAMANRLAPGPFYTAPIVQGEANDLELLTDDALYLSRGSVVAGTQFYTVMDGYQGSVVLWWTPELNSADWSGGGDSFVFSAGGDFALRYEYDNNRFLLEFGDGNITVNQAITAGTTYCLVIRWDFTNTLDGTNYVCLSINDSNNFGNSSGESSVSVAGSIMVGGNSTSPIRAGNGLFEGLTIYRRPLFDGTYGIDVGNGDEINLIYNAGSGTDPCLITGSWDVCFCLPTDSTAGELTTGTGQAWSMPHASNLIPGNSNAGGFMMDGTYGTDGWSDEGTPSAVAALAAAEKIFAGGYKTTSDAADEGLYQDVTVTAGDDFVIRVLAHSDGTSVPVAILYDQTNTAEIGRLAGSTASTRSAPDVLLFTGEAPAGCTTLRVKLINTAASGVTYWHQCELYENLITNPSMETGAGDPWIPTGWSNSNLDAGEAVQELFEVHSGSSSVNLVGGLSNEALRFDNYSTAEKFFGAGIFIKGTSGKASVFFAGTGNAHIHSNPSGDRFSLNIPASWTHLPAVIRAKTNNADLYIGDSGTPGAGDWFLDDTYTIALDDVSLTVTPASEANSTESSGLRVDGADTLTQPITDITATSGKIRFNWTPRHGNGDFRMFFDDPEIMRAWNNSDNYIEVRSSSATKIVLIIRSGGSGTVGAGWSPTNVVAGQEYLVEVEYSDTQATLSFDGVVRDTVIRAIDYGVNVPDVMYWGSDQSGNNQHDATFAAPSV